MAKGIYINANGNIKKARKIFVGVNNSPKRVKKIFIGDENNSPKICYAAEATYTYTGRSTYVIDSNGENWELALLSSGTLTFQNLPDNQIDVFLVGGGYSGEGGENNSNGPGAWGVNGGNGGRGGSCYSRFKIFLNEKQSYSITVAGAGGTSYAFGYSSSSTASDGGKGIYHSGGAGGTYGSWGCWTGDKQATNGGKGNLAFDTADSVYSPGYRYGAGGGGGGSAGYNVGDSSLTLRQPGSGGANGGGTGGYPGGGIGGEYVGGGYSATPNSGSGGGGGWSGGSGATGIVIIRNHR